MAWSLTGAGNPIDDAIIALQGGMYTAAEVLRIAPAFAKLTGRDVYIYESLMMGGADEYYMSHDSLNGDMHPVALAIVS